MSMTGYPAGPHRAGAGRRPRGVDLAEIQSRAFYQPPEVDLTPLFLDTKVPPPHPYYPELCGLTPTRGGHREAGHKGKAR